MQDSSANLQAAPADSAPAGPAAAAAHDPLDASLFSAGQAPFGQEGAKVQVQAGNMENVRPVPRVSIQAFCESELVAGAIDQASQDRRMSRAHVKVQLGGIAAAVELYQNATTPNLIIVESRHEAGRLLVELEELANVCDEGTHVVVVGHHNDVALYRELSARGVAEYLVAPVTMADIMGTVSNLFVSPDAPPLGQSIAFIGSKGGVGSSTIAHNVAWSIASRFESDVMLADFDLAFGTANIDFDQDPPQGVADAVFSSERLDDTLVDRLVTKCSDHLSLLAAPSTLEREYDFSPDDFSALLDVAQRGTPNVVVDLPHMWTGWVKRTLATADQVVITATPDLASLRNTKNLIDTLAEIRPNDAKPFLVLNQVGVPKKPEISVSDFIQPLDVQPAITIPFDPALFGLASNNGQMISETDPKSEIANTLVTLSNIVTGRQPDLGQKRGSLSVGGLLSRLRASKG